MATPIGEHRIQYKPSLGSSAHKIAKRTAENKASEDTEVVVCRGPEHVQQLDGRGQDPGYALAPATLQSHGQQYVSAAYLIACFGHRSTVVGSTRGP
jgi:hypothetical protein